MMDIEIDFTDQAIRIEPCPVGSGVGAVLEFQGAVRNSEEGTPIAALIYELYEPMAGQVIRKILQTLHESYPCRLAKVVHRHGVVPAGEVSIYVRIESAHRREGLRMMEEFMNLLKTDVPIWKTGSLPC